ncbi:MAG: hypothetical protein JSR59_09260 [Proteobacteria bacterium]|nr:hypothetical protein [Pseudomonadota bacterium]
MPQRSHPRPYRLPTFVGGVVLAAMAAPAHALVVVSGSVDATVGNQGNPATRQVVGVTGNGTYAAGPLTGSGGDNTTEGNVEVSSTPSLVGHATGTTAASSLDAAYTFVGASMSYGFTITGPSAASVPVRFSGITSGTLASQGDPQRLYGDVGSRLSVVAQNIAGTFAASGPQSGTAPTYLAFDADTVSLGWGVQSSEPVGYTDYDASWTWGATLPEGLRGTLTLSISMRGGTTGQLTGLPVLTASTADARIAPFIFIDPGWLADHPGYAIAVDAGIGNTNPVPEPASAALMMGGLAAILCALGRCRLG